MRVLLVVTILIAFLAVLALAANDDGTDKGSRFDPPADSGSKGKRKLEFQLLPHSFRIKAGRVDADQKTRFLFEFTTNGFPRLRLSRFSFDEANDNNTQFTFRVGFRRIVEFVDSGDNCFDLNDTVVGQYSLIGHVGQWSNIERTVLQVEDANTNQTVNVTRLCTTLTRPNGAFTLCVKLADQPIFDGRHTYGPRRLKIDIRFENYNFVNADGQSKLALIAVVYSRVRATNETAVPRALFFSQQGAFDWDGVLDTNLGPMDVRGSSLLDISQAEEGEEQGNESPDDDDRFKTTESGAAVAFCIDNATHASWYDWDPSTEINDESGASGVVVSLLLPLVLAALTLFGLKN